MLPGVDSILVAVFLGLHGLVHAWYVAVSRGLVDTEDVGWSGTSWLLTGVVDPDTLLDAASVLYVLAAAGFVAGGAGYLAAVGPWRPLLLAAAALSAGTILVMWGGGWRRPVEKGAVGILIDLAVAAWLLGLP